MGATVAVRIQCDHWEECEEMKSVTARFIGKSASKMKADVPVPDGWAYSCDSFLCPKHRGAR